MNVQQLKRFCRRFPGATEKLYLEPGNVLVYHVGGKSFAWFKTSQPERWRFSVRVASDRFLGLTDAPGIKPARYMARYHWITIVNVATVPDDFLVELVQWSYQKALASLSGRKREAILADASRRAKRSSSRRAP